MRMEPPPSLACASGTTPAATRAAEPPLDPPAERPVFQGLPVAPKRVDSVLAVRPNSGRVVFAMGTNPRRRSWSTKGESAAARCPAQPVNPVWWGTHAGLRCPSPATGRRRRQSPVSWAGRPSPRLSRRSGPGSLRAPGPEPPASAHAPTPRGVAACGTDPPRRRTPAHRRQRRSPAAAAPSCPPAPFLGSRVTVVAGVHWRGAQCGHAHPRQHPVVLPRWVGPVSRLRHRRCHRFHPDRHHPFRRGVVPDRRLCGVAVRSDRRSEAVRRRRVGHRQRDVARAVRVVAGTDAHSLGAAACHHDHRDPAGGGELEDGAAGPVAPWS